MLCMFTADIKSKSTILGLLYHASMDDKVKGMFANIDCIPMVCTILRQMFE